MVSSLIMLVVYLIVIGLVCFLLNYLVDALPLAEPFHRMAKIAILVVGVLIVILLLLQFIGVMDGGTSLRIR